MYRLIQVVKEKSKENETQSIYPFQTFTEAQGEYETKLGQCMKSELYDGYFLVVVDEKGEIPDDGQGTMMLAKGGEHSFRPRLLEVKTTTEEEQTLSAYDTVQLVSANLHSKWGAAIKDNTIKIEMLRGLNMTGITGERVYWTRPVETTEPSQPQGE